MKVKNPKLIALFKEFPWLTSIKEKIVDSSVVKVQKLGTDVLYREVGTIETLDDSYWLYGYMFDDQGENLGSVTKDSKKPLVSRFLFFVKNLVAIDYPKRNCQYVREVLENHEQMDKVRYLVLYGHELNHYGSLQLYVYKVSKGRVVSEIIKLANKLILRKKRKAMKIATSTLSSEVDAL